MMSYRTSNDGFDWEIALAAQTACVLEADAPKPGNVNRYYDFDDATLEDFHLSALAIGLPFAYIRVQGVGKTVLESVKAVRRCVSTNTNLGILLLLAPLGLAWSRIRDRQNVIPIQELPELWKKEIRWVLDNLTIEDTAYVYQAIREASPGGMGDVDEYDVHGQAPSITLLEAMRPAAERDMIAQQYVDGFSFVLGQGYEMFASVLQKGLSMPQAINETFIYLLSLHADTLIARKVGKERSVEVQRLAQMVIKGQMDLKDFDHMLRSEKHALNPGTTADLITGVVFVYLLERSLTSAP